jgi:molybdopterin synthase sulfur carrier subunit
MAVVHIASSLAPYADRERRLLLEGSTVEEVLSKLGDRYPGLRKEAFDGDGSLRPHITLFLNGAHIRGDSDLGTDVGEGDEIAVISAIAGG